MSGTLKIFTSTQEMLDEITVISAKLEAVQKWIDDDELGGWLEYEYPDAYNELRSAIK